MIAVLLLYTSLMRSPQIGTTQKERTPPKTSPTVFTEIVGGFFLRVKKGMILSQVAAVCPPNAKFKTYKSRIESRGGAWNEKRLLWDELPQLALAKSGNLQAPFQPGNDLLDPGNVATMVSPIGAAIFMPNTRFAALEKLSESDPLLSFKRQDWRLDAKAMAQTSNEKVTEIVVFCGDIFKTDKDDRSCIELLNKHFGKGTAKYDADAEIAGWYGTWSLPGGRTVSFYPSGEIVLTFK